MFKWLLLFFAVPSILFAQALPRVGRMDTMRVWVVKYDSGAPSFSPPAAQTYLWGDGVNGLKYQGVTGGVKTISNGTVTSVGLILPSWLSVSGSPITTSGSFTVTAATGQTANQVLATPDGSSGALAVRALVGADLPNPSASTLGGVKSLASVASKWINTISTSGVPSATQPAFSDLTGSVAASQMPALTGDVTTSAGSVATTIANSAVTNAKIANSTIDLTAKVTGALPIANGGTANTTASAAFDALSPTTTRGDIATRGASSNARLALGSQYKTLSSNGTDAIWDAVHLDQAAAVTGLLPNGSLANSSITLNASTNTGYTAPGAMTLGSTYTFGATSDNLYINGLGLGVAAPTTAGRILSTLGANNVTGLLIKRNTDTSPTGNFEDFQNAAATSLWTISIAGTLTTGTWNGSVIGMAYGGMNANLTASNGGILYSTASAGAILSGTATANKVLMSGSSAAPVWSTPTYPNAAPSAGTFPRGDGTNFATSTLTIPNTSTTGDVFVSTGTSAMGAVAVSSTANKVLMSGASAVPTWSTPTFPNASATSLKHIRSDGTNWIASTVTYPDAAVTAGKVMISDGTNYIASTPTYPNSAGTNKNFLQSDGTNFVSVAITDTNYAKYGWYALTAGDSAICWVVREGNCTVREIRAIRTGGTSASINVTKNTSTDLLTANYATTTSDASAGTLQNNTVAVGDIIRTTVRAVAGTPTEIYIQILYDHPAR